MDIIAIIVFWIIIAIVGGIVAENKGRSGTGWFFACFVLSSLMVLIVLALPAIESSTLSGHTPHSQSATPSSNDRKKYVPAKDIGSWNNTDDLRTQDMKLLGANRSVFAYVSLQAGHSG